MFGYDLSNDLFHSISAQKILGHIQRKGLGKLKITVEGSIHIFSTNELCQVCDMKMYSMLWYDALGIKTREQPSYLSTPVSSQCPFPFLMTEREQTILLS